MTAPVLRLAQVLDVGCPPELEAIIGVGVNINRYQRSFRSR